MCHGEQGVHLDLDKIAVLAVDQGLPSGDRLIPEAEVGHAPGPSRTAIPVPHRQPLVAGLGLNGHFLAVVLGPDLGPNEDVVVPDILAASALIGRR